jgi:hypothetical protein
MDIALAIIFILFAVGFLAAALWHDFEASIASLWGFSFLAIGLFLLHIGLEPTSLEKCTEHYISYELVETVAENTDYTIEEVTDFFIIVNDNMEAWDAIKLLDSSLTDEQINAIMEISAMKQEE